MRLFIAIPLSEKLKQTVSAVQDTFYDQGVRGNYTPEENLHVTLAFIGEYNDPDRVMDSLEELSFKPFTVTMDRLGCFGDLWWTGFQESEALELLAGKVRRMLSDAGIPYDRKRFKPHVTILRRPVYTGSKDLRSSVPPAEMTVEKISLMCSTRGKHGMIYTEIGSIEAGKH